MTSLQHGEGPRFESGWLYFSFPAFARDCLCAADGSGVRGTGPPERGRGGKLKKVGLRKRSTTATKNYIVETRQGPAPTNVPSEVQCKDRWYVGSLLDQARHQSGM